MAKRKPAERILVGVRLPPELVKWMRVTAALRGMNLQGFVQQALQHYRVQLTEKGS